MAENAQTADPVTSRPLPGNDGYVNEEQVMEGYLIPAGTALLVVLPGSLHTPAHCGLAPRCFAARLTNSARESAVTDITISLSGVWKAYGWVNKSAVG